MNINLRVYGVLHNHNGEVLLLRESFMGEIIIKLPGGGMEYGEGTVETLTREFKEELNLEVSVVSHIYTQDFHQESRIPSRGQLLIIYYKVYCESFRNMLIQDLEDAEVLWVPVNEVINYLQLPVDKVMWDIYTSNNSCSSK